MTSSLRAVAPDRSAADLTLDALRSEIDEVDDRLLDLLERRMALAARVGLFKVAGDGLNLKPDREARVVSRLLDRASPRTRALAEPLWREVLAAGLAAQGAVEVRVWPGARGDLNRLARGRFGGAPTYRDAASPVEALAAARDGAAVAVLALDGDEAWWADLPEDLWAFEALSGRAGPLALAVGRVDPLSLAHGTVLRVSMGGDAGDGSERLRLLAGTGGARLYAGPDRGEAPDRARGVIGRLPLRP